MGLDELYDLAPIPQLLENGRINCLMYMIWQSRKDLQCTFDLSTHRGQAGFVTWCQITGLHEYGFLVENANAECPTSSMVKKHHLSIFYSCIKQIQRVLSKIVKNLPTPLKAWGKIVLHRLAAFFASLFLQNVNEQKTYPRSLARKAGYIGGLPGANLIGYAHAELGMGEHVRMSAAALKSTNMKFGVVNFAFGLLSRQKATFDQELLISTNTYKVNIFHINADQMLKAYCHIGQDFFRNRYNIGYWAWELPRCPEEWIPIINSMVDEIWAPSRFIQQAFAEKTSKFVRYMPLCVSLPKFQERSRSYFNIPEDCYIFLFAFDFFSYIERKNPFATIKSFQSAFPERSNRVGLVIKIMNGDTKSKQWVKMMEMIKDDDRIRVVNGTLDREEMLALLNVCDCFVSLHRAEGFGRGPAEAMYLGKPVIVTNYSGNTDFTLMGNSCLVDYRLIPVESGQYVFENEQVWADVDVEHAAWHMQRLVNNQNYSSDIGRRGKEFIHANFNTEVIGKLYFERLECLGFLI